MLRRRTGRWLPLASGVLLFATIAFAGADRIERLPWQEAAYQPTEDGDAIQAWNYNFHGNGVRIYATVVVSNLGPGDRNNGVSVLVRQNGRQTIRTAEYNEDLFEGKAGAFGAKVFMSEIGRPNGRYILTVRLTDLEIDLEMEGAAGIRLTGGPIATEEAGVARGYVRADIPHVGGAARGRLKIGETETALQGVAGLESMQASASPHAYAKSLRLTRTYSAGRGGFLAYMRTTSSFPGGDFASYAQFAGARVDGQARLQLTDGEEIEDSFSGYRIQKRLRFQAANGCIIEEELGRNIGQYYIIEHVSALLRWVIRTFFTKPYILHYQSKMQITCGAQKESFDTITSIYLIND